MLVVVNQPLINDFRIEGMLSSSFLDNLRKEFGDSMKIIRQGIETDAANYTRFFVIARDENSESFRSRARLDKAAVLFSVSDEPGALLNALKVFSDKGVNMSKLESRPIPGKPWEYLFFTEIKVDDLASYDELQKAVKEKTTSFRSLGLYTSVLK